MTPNQPAPLLVRLKPALLLFTIAFLLRLASLLLASQVLGLSVKQIVGFQDGPSYIFLATSWPPYAEAHTVIHFPFYPLVIKLLAFGMPAQYAALLVSLVAGSVAVVVYGQVLRRYSEQWFALALIFAVFPFRWFNISQLAMSEALFLLLLLWSFQLLENEQIGLAGGVLGLACVTKLSGIFLFPMFFYKLYELRQPLTRNLRWLIPACAGLVLLGLYLQWRFGSFAIYFQQHNQLWGGSYFSYPFSAYVSGFADATIAWYRKPYIAFVVVFYLGGLLIGCLRWRRNQPTWVVWMLWALPFLLLQTVLHGKGINWGFISTARLLMPAAPPILLFWLHGIPRHYLYLLFALLIPLTLIYTIAEFRVQ
ncbi:MAG: hypothetical protein HY231_18150 [Acidobacteria bacterium]|nr:hypothetical protein [Acidobacteriota bacterium]